MNVDRVRELFIKENSTYAEIAARDLFAMGCYFLVLGNREVGFKNVATALRAINVSNADEIEIYKVVERDPEDYFYAVAPHCELKTLFRDLKASLQS